MVFNSMKNKPALEDRKMNLQKANGTFLKVDRYAFINFRIGRLAAKRNLYVIHNLDRNIVLSLHWLHENDAHIYYNVGALYSCL